MDMYKQAKKLRTLLALCFSQVSETYHHWRIFAPGNSGVSIEFDRAALLAELTTSGVTCSSVHYKTMNDLAISKIKLEDLPFIKRAAFGDEKEFRMVFSSKRLALATKDFPISLSSINRVAINPWLPAPLFTSIRETLLALDDCKDLTIYQSQLIESPLWKKFAGRYA